MDGSRAAECIIGSQREIEFSDILFTTNAHNSILLPFFRNDNLHYIIDHATTLPTMKSNPLPGEMKGQFILNIYIFFFSDMMRGTKGCRNFGEELSLDLVNGLKQPRIVTGSTSCRTRMEMMVLTPTGGLLIFLFLMHRKTRSPSTMLGRSLSSNYVRNIVLNPQSLIPNTML